MHELWEHSGAQPIQELRIIDTVIKGEQGGYKRIRRTFTREKTELTIRITRI